MRMKPITYLLRNFAIVLILVILYSCSIVNAQIPSVKKDTVYYLIDTTKVPLKDRMFLVGQEGSLYGYRLTCECNLYHEDFIFSRSVDSKFEQIDRKLLKNIKFISLRELIHIAVKYGTDKIDRTVFYFVEVQNKKYNLYKVRLVVGPPPATGY